MTLLYWVQVKLASAVRNFADASSICRSTLSRSPPVAADDKQENANVAHAIRIAILNALALVIIRRSTTLAVPKPCMRRRFPSCLVLVHTLRCLYCLRWA